MFLVFQGMTLALFCICAIIGALKQNHSAWMGWTAAVLGQIQIISFTLTQ